MSNQSKSPVVATFAIILGISVLFYLMPTVMVWLAEISPMLAVIFGTISVLAFFAIFWFRAKHQNRVKSDL